MRSLGALLLLGAACSSPPSTWRVHDGAIVDPDGDTIVLRGLNVSSRHKSPPYFDYQQPADWALARSWGFNAVRFLVEWTAIEPSPGVYDEAYLDAVAQRIGELRTAGLWVVLDMHQDVYGSGFPIGNGAPPWTCDAANYAGFTQVTPWFANYLASGVEACFDHLWTDAPTQDRFAAMWRHVAEKLAAYDNVIGFDILNEPHWGSYSPIDFEADRLGPFYRQTIARVRQVAPHWLAFAEPSSGRNVGIASSLDLRGVDGVVYAAHSYDTEAEGGNGFSAERRAAVIGNVMALRNEATAMNAALWIGEYGGVAAQPGIYDYMDAQYAAIGAVAGGSAYWHFSKDNGYGILDADGNEKPELMRALVRPYPERTHGALLSYAWDDSSRTLTIATAHASRLTVRWPARLGTPAAACGGCRVESGDGTMTLSGALPSTVTISAN